MEGAPKQTDSPNIVAIIVIGMIGALVVYASFVALQAFYNAEADKLQAQRDAEGASRDIRALKAEQQAELTGYRMIEPRKKIVSLPIERAMQAVVKDVHNGNSNNLVPAVGPQDMPTVPAVYGRPSDNPAAPSETTPPGEGKGAAPAGAEGGAEGAAPAGAAGGAEGGAEGAAPAGAAGAGAVPASGATPANGQGAAGNTPAGAAAQPANPGGDATP